ncbi:hypothetical protein HPB49_010386 [Dermacentor silvarum]|uniref:Uncharacterized protein n=1 Tax=Dermacentor silvarum TaxID=543639 RepID=A0ACB8DIK0_DERSI|nr:hypothetical protein HPB49_010386 [Dermacentor silvarum]
MTGDEYPPNCKHCNCPLADQDHILWGCQKNPPPRELFRRAPSHEEWEMKTKTYNPEDQIRPVRVCGAVAFRCAQSLFPHPRRQYRDSPYIPPDLETTTHVFVHRDAVCKHLQCPYDDSYRIIKRSDKVYTLDLHGRHDSVSIDRLKASIVEDPLPRTIPDHAMSPISSPLLRCIL